MRYATPVIVTGLALALSACAATSRPTLYPNETFQKAGPAQADADISYCMNLADQYVKDPNRYADMAKGGVVGGAVGAGTGAIAGAITKSNVGRATGAGAAVGSIIGVLDSARKSGQRTPNYERFVEHCLHEKGYQIIGWD